MIAVALDCLEDRTIKNAQQNCQLLDMHLNLQSTKKYRLLN